MAWRTKAALLPAFAFIEEDGAIRVTIEAPIKVPDDPSGGAAVEQAARAYAMRLEPYVLRYPGQWSGWIHF